MCGCTPSPRYVADIQTSTHIEHMLRPASLDYDQTRPSWHVPYPYPTHALHMPYRYPTRTLHVPYTYSTHTLRPPPGVCRRSRMGGEGTSSGYICGYILWVHLVGTLGKSAISQIHKTSASYKSIIWRRFFERLTERQDHRKNTGRCIHTSRTRCDVPERCLESRSLDHLLVWTCWWTSSKRANFVHPRVYEQTWEP